MATGHSSTLSKGLRLLQVFLADGGRSTLSTVSERAGLPLPTAHRLALTLEADGYLVRHGKGSFLPGPQLQRFGAVRQGTADAHATRIRRRLAQFARRHRVLVHFGVLDDGMVTYLVKENGGTEGLFTAEQMQLEAYCSAVGKVLLAALPDDQCEAYLANGPFVALTRQTLTDPDDIRRELAEVRETGAAFDRFEIREERTPRARARWRVLQQALDRAPTCNKLQLEHVTVRFPRLRSTAAAALSHLGPLGPLAPNPYSAVSSNRRFDLYMG